MFKKSELGKKGEQAAEAFLKEKGYEILKRNYRYGHGEIDIIAKDPEDGYLVFVEVKTRKNLEFGEPEYGITSGKIRQLKKVAELYLADNEIYEADCRFDVIAIIMEDEDNPSIKHYVNAFMW